jgi:hypothetical protein
MFLLFEEYFLDGNKENDISNFSLKETIIHTYIELWIEVQRV